MLASLIRPVRPVLFALAFAAPLAGGCFFIDDAPSNGATRGYTYCGDFADEEVWCHPGQYCEDPVFTSCEIGCLSDVNCASNQFCDIHAAGEPGTCRNEASTVRVGLTADTGIRLDAGGADGGAD